MQISLDAVRIHGGYGYSTEYDVDRHYRGAPLPRCATDDCR